MQRAASLFLDNIELLVREAGLAHIEFCLLLPGNLLFDVELWNVLVEGVSLGEWVQILKAMLMCLVDLE